MLEQQHRIVKRDDFAKAHKRGRFVGGAYLSAKVLKNNLPHVRFAFLVSTKVSKRAVDRNKVKRRLREIVRSLLPDTAPGVDVVFLTKKDILTKSYSEIEKSVKKILKKARVIS